MADQNSWTDDIRLITEWQLKAFLGYVASEKRRWGIEGNGSENAHRQVTYSTVRHYYVVLDLLQMGLREEYITTNPMVKDPRDQGHSRLSRLTPSRK